jgi:hypothetical protein
MTPGRGVDLVGQIEPQEPQSGKGNAIMGLEKPSRQIIYIECEEALTSASDRPQIALLTTFSSLKSANVSIWTPNFISTNYIATPHRPLA